MTDSMTYTVRDEEDEIVASFDSEAEAFEYGSHLANANPDKLYAVYGIRVISRGDSEEVPATLER